MFKQISFYFFVIMLNLGKINQTNKNLDMLFESLLRLMEKKMRFIKPLGILFMIGFLSACDNDSNFDTGETQPTDTTAPNAPSANTIKSLGNNKITITGTAEKNSTITITLADGTTKTATTDNNGKYTISFDAPKVSGDIKVTSSDEAGNKSKPATIESDQVTKVLYQTSGNMPDLTFKPSLGVNTEAPQGGADTVGQAMPFVDVFRTARPFTELSFKGTEFDIDGWPTKLPDSSLEENKDKNYTRTKVLQGTLSGAIPNGKYTLLYEQTGGDDPAIKLELGGKAISNVKGLSGEQLPNKTKGFTFDFILKDSDNPESNALSVIIRGITPENYIKDIRIIMPGGSCRDIDNKYNPYIHVTSQSECPENTTYVSFAERLKENRNAVIFNPDYLMFLRNFKVVRMMNLMEASHATHNCYIKDNEGKSIIDETCLTEELSWKKRAKLDHAVWGGNDGRTSHHKRNGAPVEVIVKLANQLKRDIWISMPHNATNEYIIELAQYFYTELDSSIKIYLEYSNEVWNSGFLGHHYAEKKGIEAGLDQDIPDISSNRDGEYFARLRYASQRSVELFRLWATEFGSNTDRFIRVLGTSQGDTVLSDQMIKHLNNKYGNYKSEIDAIAMAPYFHGCANNAGSCEDAPKTIIKATTVDDIFDILDHPYKDNGNVIDPNALDATIEKIKLQAKITAKYNLQLLTYEGGQHLTIMGAMGKESEKEKARLRLLFQKANRDPRMKARYEKLLNAWKSTDSATLFTLYTLPQSFYRFGNWGLKEHLNKPRADSPKFDAAMSFQEIVKTCWWDGCKP
jgi:hypothetical protein